MYLRGVLVFLAGIFFILLLCTNFDVSEVVGTFYDIPTLFAFIIVIASVIISTGGFKTLIVAVNALLSKKYSISAADKERGIRLLQLISKSINYAMIFLTIIALMIMLRTLSDPATLGPMASIALSSIFYGILINMVFIYPAINLLQTRYNTEEKTIISEKQVIDKLLELCYKQGVSPEEILNANEIQFKKCYRQQ